MDYANELLNSIPNSAYYVALASLIISVLLQKFKGWFNLKSDKVVTFLFMALSFLTVAIDYLVSAASANPTILGERTFVIMGVATVIYRYLVKPMSLLVNDAKLARQNTVPSESFVPSPVTNIATVVTPGETFSVTNSGPVDTAPVADEPQVVKPVTPAEFNA